MTTFYRGQCSTKLIKIRLGPDSKSAWAIALLTNYEYEGCPEPSKIVIRITSDSGR